MTTIIHLGPNQIVEQRPFTHPAHSFTDLSILHYMIDRLCLILKESTTRPAQPIFLTEPDGRAHRLVLIRPRHLTTANNFATVGFFGQKRGDVPYGYLDALDEVLLSELSAHPGMLSYCTLRLPHGDFGNLVLFTSLDDISDWSRSPNHARAVDVSPGYYASVRIYNGILPGGVSDSKSLRLNKAKYFDYQSHPIWQAVREIQEA